MTDRAIRRKPTQPSEPQGVRAQPTLDQALDQLRIEAERIQKPNAQPTLAEVTPVTEDAGELRKCLVLGALNSSWQSLETIATRINEPRELVAETLNQLVDEGRAFCFGLGGAWRSGTPIVNVIDPEPTRQQSASMTIGGRLTAVGETFAGITSGGKTMTLTIDADQARWLGQHVGRDVRLTVEVTL